MVIHDALPRIIFTAINNGWLARDPFYAYHITKEETKRGFLTKEEITALINGTFKKKSYELIRDLFIFCCFTGLSWRDMYNLTEENLQTSFDGHLWIKTNRQKTGVESNIRLLDVPRHIIEKYSGMAEGGRLLPSPAIPIADTASRQSPNFAASIRTSPGTRAVTRMPPPSAFPTACRLRRCQK